MIKLKNGDIFYYYGNNVEEWRFKKLKVVDDSPKDCVCIFKNLLPVGNDAPGTLFRLGYAHEKEFRKCEMPEYIKIFL